jgi:hypothetical protein
LFLLVDRMKLYAYIEPTRFNVYLKEKHSVETEESISQFLREVGTSGIAFNKIRVGYIEVPPGSCIRLHSKPIKVSPAVVTPLLPCCSIQ